MKRFRSHYAGWSCAFAVLAAASLSADITGFHGLDPGEWTYNQLDSGVTLDLPDAETVHFTTGANNRRSLWYAVPQNITEFHASFTYRLSGIGASAQRQGVTFALQNAAQGLAAIGFGGDGFGYEGIAPSAAITIEADTGPALTYTGYYAGGVLGGGSVATTPVNAFSFRDIQVNIDYAGSVLSVGMSEGSNVFPTRNYFVGSLSSIVGGSTAYIGFTGGTFNTLGSGGGASQYLSNFRYTVPEPASLLGLSSLALLALRRRS